MKTHSKHIFSIVTILLFVYMLVAYFYIDESKKGLLDKKYTEIADITKESLQTLINEKRDAILLLSLALTQNDDIRDVLLHRVKDLNVLKFKKLSKELEENSPLKNIWFHLLDNKGNSIYKSWSAQHGENVVSKRLDIAKMLKHPQVMNTISTGQFNITFKSIVPIYNKGKFIGMIETVARFNSIEKKMKDKGYATLLLVDKRYKKQLHYALTKKFIDGYYVATQNPDQILLYLFEKKYHQKLLHIDNYMIDRSKNLLITTYYILDINGQDMAYFLISKRLSDVDFSDIDRTLKNIVFVFIFIAFFVLALVYYLYVVKYREFIEQQNQKLEQDVAYKTRELYHRAHHDALTELPNRVLFTEKLHEAILISKEPLYVLFLDLDRFKEVNDTYGHDIGDRLLQMVTHRLNKVIAQKGVISRFGGDEFTILVKDISYEEMEELAENILMIMQKHFIIAHIKINTTFSIGISSYPKDGKSVEELLKNADIAMYEAKLSGKNRYMFYDISMSQIAQEKMQLEQDLKQALKNSEFEAYFQPKVDALTLQVVGLEALIRWNHPSKGLIFPDKFIPFAEEIGLIVEIDSYMKREILRITKGWCNQGLEFGKVSFNASTIELESEDFVKHLQELIVEFEYDTSHLELEILESQSMQNKEYMKQILTEVKALGISVSMDDFGTGYSSLSYLKQLPIDKLKIDRSFLLEIPQDEASVALVRTIITLAHNFDLEVIAEGAETKEQIRFLVEEGCRTIQGYYYSKPVKAEVLESMLRDGLSRELAL